MQSGIPLLDAIQGRIKYHSARAEPLAQNVANADTPGYKARDIAEPDFKDMLAKSQKSGMKLTNSKHMSGSVSNMAFDMMKRKTTYELNPNGNNVVLEEELINVSKNQSEYQRALSLYSKMNQMINSALGRNGGGG